MYFILNQQCEYYSTIYDYVFQVVSSIHVFLSKLHMHFLSIRYMLHVKRYGAVLSTLLLPPFWWAQIFFTAPRSKFVPLTPQDFSE